MTCHHIDPNASQGHINATRGHHLPIGIVEVRIHGIVDVTMLVENAITQFGPLFDKEFRWIAKLSPRLIPSRYERVGKAYLITRLTATWCLLGKGVVPMHRIDVGDYDIRGTVRSSSFWWTNNGLAFAISPRGRYNNGNSFEEDSLVQGFVQPFAWISEQNLQEKWGCF